jgi:hypothetical protein
MALPALARLDRDTRFKQEPTTPQTPEPVTPEETPERLTPAEEPERLTPTPPPEPPD